MMKHFHAASWPTSLKVVSGVGAILLTAVGYAATIKIPPFGAAHIVGLVVACVPPGIALVAALFVVRSYWVDAADLRVQRLLWSTTMRIEDVQQVWHDAQAMKGSLRLLGNGGLFSITGWYHNKKLGRHRAFVTDPKKSVVLVLARRVVVVSPAEPEAFVEAMRMLFPNAGRQQPR